MFKQRELTQRELSLIYFERYQRDILQLLRVTGNPAHFDDDERLRLADLYIDFMSD
jgi:hypothetical protein